MKVVAPEVEGEDAHPTGKAYLQHLRRETCGTRTLADVADFDGVAGAYRWMEYLSLGTMLEKTRWWALDAGWLEGSRNALVLGDGDGRFTARLMRRNHTVQVHAVDASAAMLRLLERRCAPFAERLRMQCADARVVELEAGADLVVTHFFLDCLEQDEVRALVDRVAANLAPAATWVVSDFRVPDGWLHGLAWMLVRGLYLAFRLLTGLRVTRLPAYQPILSDAGFVLVAERTMLWGVLVSQVFQATATAS